MSIGLVSAVKQKVMPFGIRKMVSWTKRGVYGTEWSADSRSLVLSSAGQLYLFDVANGAFQHLKSQSDFAISPTFSPDSKTLAYYAGTLHGAELHWKIWLRDLATGKQRTLSTHLVEFPANPGALSYFHMGFTLSWHPDGYRLWIPPRLYESPVG